MNEARISLPSHLIKIAVSFIFGLVFGALVPFQFMRLAFRSIAVQYAMVFGLSLVFGILVYYGIIPLIGRLAKNTPHKLQIGLITLSLFISGVILIYVANMITFAPASHSVEISYADAISAASASDSVRLGQIELSMTGILPLSETLSGQIVGKKEHKGMKILSFSLPIEYTFDNQNDGEMADILFFVNPPGEKIIIQLDQDRSYHNLITTQSGEINISLPVYKRYTPMQIFLFGIGVGCIVVSIFLYFFSIFPILHVRSRPENILSTVDGYPFLSTMMAIILSICICVCLALLVSLISPERLSSSIVQNAVQTTSYSGNDWKIQEKVFYVVFSVLGFIFSAFVGLKWTRPVHRPLLVSLAILAWLPVVNRTAFLVMQVDPQQNVWLAICILSTVCLVLLAYASATLVRWIAGIGFLILWLVNGNQSLFYPIASDLSLNIALVRIASILLLLVAFSLVLWRTAWSKKIQSLLYAIVVIVTLFGMIFPVSLTDIAADILGDIHAPFHLYAPALYSRFGYGLMPGFDYFTQYGVGAPYLFSMLLGDTPQSAIYNYILITVVLMLIFFAATYLLLRRLLNSDRWAFAIVIISLVLQFWGSDKHLGAPSMLVFRYPLFPIILALLIAWTKNGFRFLSGLLMSALLGFSIFWTTETGISFLIACCITILIILGLSRRSFVLIAILCVETVIVFLGLSVIAFGSRALSMNYVYEGVLSPLIIYGSGYGAMPIDWKDGLPYFANLICPILAVASMSVVLTMNHSDEKATLSAPKCVLLVFCSVTMILFSAKYVNRAFLQNWHATVLPAVIVVAYWIKCLSKSLSAHTSRLFMNIQQRYTYSWNYGQLIIALALGLSFLYLIYTPELETAFTKTGLKSYITYDSIVNHYICQILPSKPGLGSTYWSNSVISQRDIDLIEKYSQPSDPVMLIGFEPGKEWEYYVAAKRLPASPVIPSIVIFNRWQSEVFKSRIPDIIFLPYKSNLNKYDYIKYPELDDYLKKVVFPQYTFVGESDTLNAYQKK